MLWSVRRAHAAVPGKLQPSPSRVTRNGELHGIPRAHAPHARRPAKRLSGGYRRLLNERSPARAAGILAAVLMLAMTLPLAAPAAIESYPQPVDYPGSIELVYYGPDPQEPELAMTRVAGRFFWTSVNVVAPTFTGVHLLEFMEVHSGESVLDVGTGSGMLAIFAADRASRVVATDISSKAVEAARYNVRRHGLGRIVEVVESDLFDGLEDGAIFDVIVANLPSPPQHRPGQQWTLHERFFRDLPEHLAAGGRVYFQAGELANVHPIESMAANAGLTLVRMDMIAPSWGRQVIAFEFHRQPPAAHPTNHGE